MRLRRTDPHTLAGAYALDALPGELWADVSAHLAGCSKHPEATEPPRAKPDPDTTLVGSADPTPSPTPPLEPPRPAVAGPNVGGVGAAPVSLSVDARAMRRGAGSLGVA